MDFAKYTSILRSMIEFEIQRYDDRVKTLLTLQGLLFAALGFSWGKDPVLPIIFGIVGLISTIASVGHLGKARIAIARLESKWNEKCTNEPEYAGPPLMGLESYEDMKLLGRYQASHIYSFAFGIAWGGIFVAGVAHIFKMI